MTKYTNESLEKIIGNIIFAETRLCPTLTANAMQSINHQNCVLVVVRGNNYADKKL